MHLDAMWTSYIMMVVLQRFDAAHILLKICKSCNWQPPQLKIFNWQTTIIKAMQIDDLRCAEDLERQHVMTRK
jgi:hypothetical protein